MGNQGLKQHVETSQKTGFPPELVKVVGVLRSIDLSENKITEIPQNIGAFLNLKLLNLNSNLIEVIPEQLGVLVKLETLYLSQNRIKVIPVSVQKLPKLKDINLSGNTITVFPAGFASLKFLSVLDLSKNRITDVPDGISGLQVVELILNQNQIKKVSADLAKCPNLKTLRLQENCLSIENFPVQILSDSHVALLSVEGNLFDEKKLHESEGYDKYMERYTTTKKKLT
ncbi:leucine-rich repeat-containing protein 57 isoform X2 [Folsomia candida]|uniref:leucine-rich repeat-containing protein 57 isoform X2 n=1 Tax=Folsomia candida TaxID=158441 RepID=UPI001604E916|nr:leucine-rich repeat-containing protein 57 isoform X2 [Folsomia candida]